LLRVTVALPVSVATLPTGSSAVACAGEGAVAAAGACAYAGWICANLVRPDSVFTEAGIGPTSIGEGIAKTFTVPASAKQPTSESGNENRRRVTMESRARME